MAASASLSLGYKDVEDDLKYGSVVGGTKEGTSATKGTTTGETKNSGSVNVSDTMNNTTTSGSVNTGSQTTTTGGSSNVTANSGSTNTTNMTSTTGESKNSTTNSGSINTIVTGASRNEGGTNASQNKTTIGGSTSTVTDSGSVNTSQVMLSQEAVERLTAQIMEGTSGLAAVSSMQNASGAYDTTVRSMLVNDLLARTAGEVAVKGAKTVQVRGGSTLTTVNSGSVNIEDIGATTNYQNMGGSTTTQNIGGSTTNQIVGATTSTQKGITDIGANSAVTALGGTTSSSNNMQTIGGNTTTGSGHVVNTLGASTTSSTGTTDSMTTIFEKLLSETQGWSERDMTEKTAQAEVKAGWILCTELRNQGRMDRVIYAYGLKEFNSYDQATKDGYYVWAVPALAHLRAHPNSMLSNILCKLLNARASQIAAIAGCNRASKTMLGAFAKSLSGVCWMLGNTFAAGYVVPNSTSEGV